MTMSLKMSFIEQTVDVIRSVDIGFCCTWYLLFEYESGYHDVDG